MRLMIIVNKINSTIDYGNLNNQNQICKFHAQNLELTMRSIPRRIPSILRLSGYLTQVSIMVEVEKEQIPK